MGQRVEGKALVFAVDVAKVEQYGVLMDSEREVMVTVKWAHSAETAALLERLRDLPCGSLTAVMESIGVYGDTLYRLYQKQHQQQQNRLEAALARHWPELTGYLALDSVTLEDLLVSFGSPAALSAQAEEGRERMRRVSLGQLAAEKIEAVLESAVSAAA